MLDWRGSYLAFFVFGEAMAKRLNLHIDKSGNQDFPEDRYLAAVVLHDHSDGVDEALAR